MNREVMACQLANRLQRIIGVYGPDDDADKKRQATINQIYDDLLCLNYAYRGCCNLVIEIGQQCPCDRKAMQR